MEYLNPGSQGRVVDGSIPYLWAQSLYILVELIDQGFIIASELDPLNRRFATETKPDTVVQGQDPTVYIFAIANTPATT